MGIANDINQGAGVRRDRPGASFGGGNATTADFAMAQKYGLDPGQYDARVSEFAARMRDYLNSDNTALEDLGNAIVGAFGFSEMEPDFQPATEPTSMNADWGFDPLSAAATIAGTAFGIPGLGAVYQGIKKATGWPGAQIPLSGSHAPAPPSAMPGQAAHVRHDSPNAPWRLRAHLARGKPAARPRLGLLFQLGAFDRPTWSGHL